MQPSMLAQQDGMCSHCPTTCCKHWKQAACGHTVTHLRLLQQRTCRLLDTQVPLVQWEALEQPAERHRSLDALLKLRVARCHLAAHCFLKNRVDTVALNQMVDLVHALL